MNVRTILAMAAAALLTLSLAGCSKEDVEKAKSSAEEAASAVTEKESN